MQFYGSPAIAGVEQCASLYRISSGWLVSYRPKPPEVVKPPADPEAEAKRLEARKASLKRELSTQAAGMALAGKMMAKGVEGAVDPWKSDDSLEAHLDEAVDMIVKTEGEVAPSPSLAAYCYPAGLGFQDQARAFSTLKEATDFLATVL